MTAFLHTIYSNKTLCQRKYLLYNGLQSQNGRRMVAEWFVMSEIKQVKAVAGVCMIKFKKVMSWSQNGRRMVARFFCYFCLNIER